MANLAVKILYALWNQFEGVVVERFFQPEDRTQVPRSVESATPLNGFDVIAATIQFELDYINFLRMLLQSQVPLRRVERNLNNDPLVIVGGPAVTTNPLPMADFVDLVVQGEVEPLTEVLLPAFYDRNLITLQGLDGIYLPESPPERPVYSQTTDLDTSFFPLAQVRNTNDRNWRESQVLGGLLLQPSRGCYRGCKFCLIGRITRPFRERSLPTLKHQSLAGSKATQTNRLTLIGSGVGDYSRLADYLQFLNEHNLKFSIPSIRADSDMAVVEEIVRSGQNTITIAPETGSDEYRFQVGKRISNDTFHQFVQEVARKGIRNLKMYFILGLPGQTMDEVHAIREFVAEVGQHFKKRDLNLTIGHFVPKRQTAFHNFPFTLDQLRLNEEMRNVAKKELSPLGSLHISPLKWAVIQTILSIGDSRIAPHLARLARTAGRHQDWVRELGGKPEKFLDSLVRQEDLVVPPVLS